MKMFKTLKISGAVAALAVLVAPVPAFAAENPQIAAAVMGLAKAQWAAEMAAKPAKDQMSTVADDYTEFNPVFPTRVDGKALATKMAEVGDGANTLMAEMQNPKVQVYGDTAILTYNYAGMSKSASGEISPSLAKSTRVYVKTGDEWKLVHAHFSAVPTN